MSEKFVLALDQGTTSSRAILYDLQGRERGSASWELKVQFPADGWVEQDPEEIWQSQISAMKEAAAGFERQIIAIGITNQRETTIVWDRKTGRALAPAIVWQCRRSADICEALRARGLEEQIRAETGLVIDSYFSATKIAWLLENVDGLRAKVATCDAVFGTVDAWLLYKLTNGATFATDYTNASRTMLLGIDGETWSPTLLEVIGIRAENLPEIRASNANFGTTEALGPKIPIRAVLGDQQASLFGHQSWEVGSGKCTFGTGAFLLVNSGEHRVESTSGLLSTIAWQHEGKPRNYALEGSIFVAGSLMQWLRDRMQFFKDVAESEALAKSVPDAGGIILVPAFVGLGTPYWEPRVRGAMFGLTRDSSRAHIARAGLESVCHQVADLLELEELRSVKCLRVDGGMAKNALFCQRLADFCGVEIAPAPSSEVTSKGVAALAAVHEGFGGDLSSLRQVFFSQEKKGKSYVRAHDTADERKRWKSAIESLLFTAGRL